MRRIDFLFVAFGVFIGCTTYTVVAPEEDAGGVDASTGDVSADTVAADGGFDVTVPDSPPPIDATGEKPAIDAAGCVCDCDKDGFRAPDAGGGGCPLPTTTGDCDDLDPRAFPDAGFRTDQPTADTKGDWNCDTHVTRQYNVNINCGDYSSVSSNCSTIEGFTSDPGCGQAGVYVHCQGLTLNCTAGMTESRVQGCK